MRHALKIALLTGSALISTPALAQTPLQAPPPQFYSVDAQGVDLTNGGFIRSITPVQIGDPNGSGMLYSRTYFNSNYRDNVTGTLTQTGTTYYLSIGGFTDTFTRSGTTYTPVQNVGQTLVASSSTTLTYARSDGTTATFDTSLADRSPLTPQTEGNRGRITSLRRPNGETWTFEYQTAFQEVQGQPDFWAIRLRQVTSNYGYALWFDFADNSDNTSYDDVENWRRLTKVTAFNLSVCQVNACPAGTIWPSASFSGSNITDQSGRTTFFGPAGTDTGTVSLAVRYPANPAVNAPLVTYSSSTGRVISLTSAGATWNYTFADASGVRTATVVDPGSGSTVATSTLSTGLLATYRNPLNETTAFTYDSSRRLTKTTFPRGNSVSYVYDGRGNVTQTTVAPPAGSTESNIVTSATYPSTCANQITCNLPETTTDARGAVTNYTYDPAHGGPTVITAPAPTVGAARPETRIAYETKQAWINDGVGGFAPVGTGISLPAAIRACATGAGNSCAGAASEVVTTIAYGPTGVGNNLHATTVTQAAGDGSLSATTTATYTATGDVASVDGPLSGTADATYFRYDSARQMVGMIDPDPDGSGGLLRRAMRLSYNADGAATLSEQGTVAGLTDPDWAAFSSLQQVAVAYDAYGRPTHQRFQAGGTTFNLSQTSYDAFGRVECVATRMNPTTFASPPNSACTLATTGSFGPDRVVKYGFDAAGRLNATTSGFGSGSTITEFATYTANGLPQTLTDGNGNVSTMVYDGFDRLSRLRYPNTTGGGSSTTDYQEYTYDPNSNVLTQRNRAGTVFTSTYDALNRQTAVSASASFTPVSYTYDNRSRLLTASIPTQTTTMAWDALGRMTSETGPLGTMAYQYDLAGRRTRQTWPDGFFVTNSWNLADEMTAILHGGTTQIIGFGYDDLGRRTSLTRGNGVTSSYGYDGASRLTSLSHDVGVTAADVTFGYTYNPANQILTKTTSNPSYVWTPGGGTTSYGIDGLNRITSVNGAATAYGLNQQMTNDTARTFNYDSAGRLLGVNGGTSTLNYDALGRVFDYVGTNGGTYIYDGNEAAGFAPVGSTSLQTRFVRGPGVDEIVAAYTSTGPTPAQYWALDERNSLVGTADGATGSSTSINIYDEYGQPGSSNLGRFQYTGQQWLPDFGLYNYKARAYNPVLGRFMQHDPIEYEAGANLYAYVGNDPINRRDSSGLQEETPPSIDDIIVIGNRKESCDFWSWCGLKQTADNIIDSGVRYFSGRGYKPSEDQCNFPSNTAVDLFNSTNGGFANGYYGGFAQINGSIVDGGTANIGIALEIREEKLVDLFAFSTTSRATGLGYALAAGGFYSTISPLGEAESQNIGVGPITVSGINDSSGVKGTSVAATLSVGSPASATLEQTNAVRLTEALCD